MSDPPDQLQVDLRCISWLPAHHQLLILQLPCLSCSRSSQPTRITTPNSTPHKAVSLAPKALTPSLPPPLSEVVWRTSITKHVSLPVPVRAYAYLHPPDS